MLGLWSNAILRIRIANTKIMVVIVLNVLNAELVCHNVYNSIQHWMNALALNASPVFVILCKYKFATFGVLGELPQWGVPVGFMRVGSE